MYTVRPATHLDVKEILDFLEEYHQNKSNLKQVPFSRQDCAKVLTAYISSRDCFSAVAVRDGEITGALFGSLEPFFFNRKKLWATDVLFIANGGGAQLLKKFKEWAQTSGAEKIIMGVSSGDERAGKLIELSGFTKIGGMYEL